MKLLFDALNKTKMVVVLCRCSRREVDGWWSRSRSQVSRFEIRYGSRATPGGVSNLSLSVRSGTLREFPVLFQHILLHVFPKVFKLTILAIRIKVHQGLVWKSLDGVTNICGLKLIFINDLSWKGVKNYYLKVGSEYKLIIHDSMLLLQFSMTSLNCSFLARRLLQPCLLQNPQRVLHHQAANSGRPHEQVQRPVRLIVAASKISSYLEIVSANTVRYVYFFLWTINLHMNSGRKKYVASKMQLFCVQICIVFL